MKILYATRLFSGLERSFIDKKWDPIGVPTIYKLIEELDKSHNVRFIFSSKDWSNGWLLSWRCSKDKVISVVDVGYVGDQGLQEVVDKSQDILANEALVKEKQAAERFFRVLGKTRDLATYGEEKVRKAIKMGAVESILITDTFNENQIEEISNLVEAQGGGWVIIDKDGRDGKTLDGLGGIGAILRYKLQL